MSQRLGSVLVFKPDVSPEDAALAIESIADFLELPDKTIIWEYKGGGTSETQDGGQVTGSHDKPFNMADRIHEFDDEMGSPVWYIP